MRYYEIPRHEIDYFRKEYEFLSNFYPTKISFDGILYRSSEAAYQAQKCLRQTDKEQFAVYVRMKRKSLDKRWKCDRAVTRHNLKLRNRLYTKNSHKILRFRKIC